MQVMRRRVFEEDVPSGHLDVAPDDLEHRTLTRDERLPVDRGSFDILEPAERIEVVLLVVVERGLVPEPLEHRVRIRVDLPVVGVVIHVGLRRGHLPPPGWLIPRPEQTGRRTKATLTNFSKAEERAQLIRAGLTRLAGEYVTGRCFIPPMKLDRSISGSPARRMSGMR